VRFLAFPTPGGVVDSDSVAGRPKNLVPAYLSLGFGSDGDACLFISNSSAKIVNGSPAEETPRERPLLGHEQIRRAFDSRDDLHDLPVIVREEADVALASQLAGRSGRPLVIASALEQAVLATRAAVPEIFALGEERRATPRGEASIDEARTVAGRVFYALNGLTDRERLAAVAQATTSTSE
jgi:hypothetical protein